MEPLGYYSGPSNEHAGWITTDTACRTCGTNLRGQHSGGRCPQCGAPAGRSVFGDLLMYADPAWLRTVRRGMGTMLWGSLALIVLLIAALLVVFAVVVGAAMTNPNAPDDQMPPGTEMLPGVILSVAFLGWLVIAHGYWRLTEPDPSGAGEDFYGSVRKAVRVTVILTVLDLLVSVALAFAFPNSFLAEDGEAPGWMVGHQFLTSALQAVATVVLVVFLCRLSTRVPEPSLTGRFRLVAWGLGISLSVYALAELATGMAGPPPATSGRGGRSASISGGMATGCINGLAALAALVFLIILLVAFIQLYSRLRKAIEAATAMAVVPPVAAQVPAQVMVPPTPQTTPPPPSMVP